MKTKLPWANGSYNWMGPVALPNIGKTYKKKRKLCQGLYKNTVNSYTLKNTFFYNYLCPTAPLVRESRGIADNCLLQLMSYLRTAAVSPIGGGSVVNKSMWCWHFIPKQMATCEICAYSKALWQICTHMLPPFGRTMLGRKCENHS